MTVQETRSIYPSTRMAQLLPLMSLRVRLRPYRLFFFKYAGLGEFKMLRFSVPPELLPPKPMTFPLVLKSETSLDSGIYRKFCLLIWTRALPQTSDPPKTSFREGDSQSVPVILCKSMPNLAIVFGFSPPALHIFVSRICLFCQIFKKRQQPHMFIS